MRFMIIVKATSDSEAGAMPSAQLIAEMADYHTQLSQAGVLLDGTGLQPSSKGWRIRHAGGKRTLVDGPFVETKELIAGYTLIDVPDRAAAVEWSLRYPSPAGPLDCEIEVRQLYELDDFAPSEGLSRMRALDAAAANP